LHLMLPVMLLEACSVPLRRRVIVWKGRQ
jgi:hypothetical protein